MIRQKSISTRLFCWLFGIGMLGLLAGGGGLYLEVRNIIYDSLDHTLLSELEIFTGLLHVEGVNWSSNMSRPSTEIISSPARAIISRSISTALL